MLTPLLEEDPRQIGPYRLQNRIGAGGMGTVYLGFTPDQRAVAVKVASEDLAEDVEFRSRFEREVHAALRVRGNAVAAVLDADTDALAPWMVTEYVEGISLAQAVRARGRLENHLVRGLAVGLADALVAIHSAGVVHRDLKPSNILLAWDGPKVIDFGVAHLTDSSTLTRTGHVIGTLAWMSPEQMRGETSGSAADIFAWANCVTYAATGRHPFHAESPDQLALRVQRDAPDLDALPAYLHSVVARSLSKDPARRPTASALLAALVGRTSVEGVTEADAVASDVLERTWTGTGHVPGDSVTVLPDAAGPAIGAGPAAGSGSAPATGAGATPAGDAGQTERPAYGWSPRVPRPVPVTGLWPLGAPPPASAFRPTVPSRSAIPSPPPLHSSRLKPLPPTPAPPPRPLPSPADAAGTRRRPRVPGSGSGGPPVGGQGAEPSNAPSVISTWTYDEDDPDPRAPVRAQPTARPDVTPVEDDWLEERERRPPMRQPGPARPADAAEETIRPGDPTPRSHPPRPAEIGTWARPAVPGAQPAGSTPPVPAEPSNRPVTASGSSARLPVRAPTRAPAPARVPPAGEIRPTASRPISGPLPRGFPTTTPVVQGLNGRALLSVVLGLGWLFGVGSVAAVVLGQRARTQIRRHNQRGERLATVGIGLGWTGIGLTATSLLIVLALR
ncbi:protein kinase [Frankia sp. Ag45/Mut15]|uniref:non-specific serine/threonine protein kinase n=1 Tax=Frankia umida TaxID=573489 RepID=A0ABT0JV64_9ACTN|nr:protein kinase [Frankia umida]MCK9874908.1 protein kinase [Frankia umida]